MRKRSAKRIARWTVLGCLMASVVTPGIDVSAADASQAHLQSTGRTLIIPIAVTVTGLPAGSTVHAKATNVTCAVVAEPTFQTGRSPSVHRISFQHDRDHQCIRDVSSFDYELSVTPVGHLPLEAATVRIYQWNSDGIPYGFTAKVLGCGWRSTCTASSGDAGGTEVQVSMNLAA